MRVRLRRGILKCSVRPWVPGSTAHRLSTIGADDQAWLVAHPCGEYISAVERGRGDAFASMSCAASQTGWRHVDVGAPAMFSGTVLAAFALARSARRTQFEATVMGRAKLTKVHGLLERRGSWRCLARG